MRAWKYLAALVLLSKPLAAQQSSPCPKAATATASDCAGVRRAALDYLEGFYEGDTAKLIRGIRPGVSKYGFWRPRDSTTYAGEAMSWSEILDYARKFKAANHSTPASAPRIVDLLEVQNETAVAKVTAWWGTDYLLLGKYKDRWMISNILWQSPPAVTK